MNAIRSYGTELSSGSLIRFWIGDDGMWLCGVRLMGTSVCEEYEEGELTMAGCGGGVG
jgi:hypothetical protein